MKRSTNQGAPSRLRRALRAIVLAALLVGFAAPAYAASIVQVRVGKHPTFSRVVFELDSHVGYQVDTRSDVDGVKVLAVTLDAASRDREIVSRSLGVGSVRVEEIDGKAVALVTLRKSGLTMKEMILSNPPRIVLDFEHAAAPAPIAKSEPAPVEPSPVVTPVDKPQVEKTAGPTMVAKPEKPEPTKVEKPAPVRIAQPAPEKAAKPEPVKTPKSIVKAEPQAKPVELAKPEPTPVKVAKPEPTPKAQTPVEPPKLKSPEPVVVQAKPPTPEPTPAAKRSLDEMQTAASTKTDPADPTGRDAIRQMTPGVHKREGLPGRKSGSGPDAGPMQDMASAVAGTQGETAAPDMKVGEQPARPSPARPKAAKPKTIAKAASPKPAEASSSIDPMMIGAIAGGVLLVAGVAFMLVRRRSIPKDLDVTALSQELSDDDDVVDPPRSTNEETEGGLDGRIPSGGFEMTEAVDTAEGLEAPVAEQNTAAYSLSEVSTNNPDDDPAAGLFDDDDSEGEKTMDMESSDLPTARDEMSADAVTTIGADVGGSDVAAMVQQLVARVGALESKLEESNDARERLERQVAAQSEELRVQRAAIARTQRALRSLNRTEEEQATEPALRDPS